MLIFPIRGEGGSGSVWKIPLFLYTFLTLLQMYEYSIQYSYLTLWLNEHLLRYVVLYSLEKEPDSDLVTLQSITERISRRQAIFPQFPTPRSPTPPLPRTLTRQARVPWLIFVKSAEGTMQISNSTMTIYTTLINNQFRVLFVAKYLLLKIVWECIRVLSTEISPKLKSTVWTECV